CTHGSVSPPLPHSRTFVLTTHRTVAYNASAHLRTDSASLTEITSNSLRVRRNKPASTPPGPSSIKKSQPSLTSRSTQSSQRTVPVTWSCNVRRISIGVVTSMPVTLLITGNRGGCIGRFASTAPSFSYALSIKRE